MLNDLNHISFEKRRLFRMPSFSNRKWGLRKKFQTLFPPMPDICSRVSTFFKYYLTPKVPRLPSNSLPNQFFPLGYDPALRYNEIQVKVAHNSVEHYHKWSLIDQISYDPKAPWNGGCLGVELDLVQDPHKIGINENWGFFVQHGGSYSNEQQTLTEALQRLARWSDSNPEHHVMTVHFDLKETCSFGDNELFAEKIDEILVNSIGRKRIFTPYELQGEETSLLEAVQTNGWPSLERLKGRFIFVLTGKDEDDGIGERRDHYVSGGKRRMAFVDIDQRALCSTEDYAGDDCCHPYFHRGDRVFLNIKRGFGRWEKLSRDSHSLKFVTRLWKANNKEQWNQALHAKIHLISTDKIFSCKWTANFA